MPTCYSPHKIRLLAPMQALELPIPGYIPMPAGNYRPSEAMTTTTLVDGLAHRFLTSAMFLQNAVTFGMKS